MLEFRILGPLEVVSETGSIRLGGPKQRATLAILLLGANEIVSIERLADDLYAGDPPVTAVTQVQRQISELRRALGSASVIETQPPGYVLRMPPEALDLHRFERQADEAARALARDDADRAASLLREALALWRGAPLADLAAESFVQTAIERLDEIRLAALEQRLDAELALGDHTQLVPELEQLVAEHPLRERFRGQLMTALYRSGRQAEALAVYRDLRDLLVRELGIEPTAALRELERGILTHDRSLEVQTTPSRRTPAAEQDRAVLVLPSRDELVEPLVTIAEPLARRPGRELIVARIVDNPGELDDAVNVVNACRSSLRARTRVAAFTSRDTTGDAMRLATGYAVDLLLVDAPPGLAADTLPPSLAATLARAPADVAIVAGPVHHGFGDTIFVPFGGGEHDWAALELAAWLASSAGATVRLVGTKARATGPAGDASRLLADASLAVQRVVGVETTPLLVEPSEDGLLAAVEPAPVVVVGISERWRRQGIGESRRALVRARRSTTLLVHRGPRPSGLAPRDAGTRFSWTVESRYLQAVSTAPT